MRRELLVLLVLPFVVLGCSGSDSGGGSPTAPTPTVPNVAGNWSGNGLHRAMSGAGCMGSDLNALFTGSQMFRTEWSIQQSGSSLTVRETNPDTGFTANFDGSINVNGQISLTSTSAGDSCLPRWICANGRSVILCNYIGAEMTFTGSVSSGTITGLLRRDYWSFDGRTLAFINNAEWRLDYVLN